MIARSKWLGGSAIALFTVAALADIGPKVQPGYKVPRTEYGHPDLQGTWTNATLTPVERDPKYGDRLVLDEKDAKALEQENQDFRDEQNKPTDPSHGIEDLPKDCGGGFSGVNCGYNNFWVDRGSQVTRINGEPRSSFLVYPENGRLPAVLPEARQRMTAKAAAFRKGAGPVDGPEIRSLGERCLMSFGSSAGPPMTPQMYNNTYTIVQNKDTVMILVEMVHDTRIIKLGAKHGPDGIKKWMGDSVGRWEGDTLVVETINFHPQQSIRGANENVKVTERFTRVARDQILYQFKVEDPTTWADVWMGEEIMSATDEKLYEYACHEGNYALPGILAGAREEERVAAEKGQTVRKKTAAEIEKELEGE